MDEEVELHLRARMHSTLKRKPRLVAASNGDSQQQQQQQQQHTHEHQHPHAHKHVSTSRQHTSSHGQSAAKVGNSASGEAPDAAFAANQVEQVHPQPSSVPRVQQISRLRCDVEVRLRVRVPPPLSAVPGPLLSTTGGLLAKLVMQALLPSFLDLLAVDYGRWAAGDANRRAIAAGSLLPAADKQAEPVAEPTPPPAAQNGQIQEPPTLGNVTSTR